MENIQVDGTQDMTYAQVCEISGGDDKCGCNQAGRDAAITFKVIVYMVYHIDLF